MSVPPKGRNREDGMADLLEDILTVESPEPELLARYAESRESLSGEELRRVEAYFEASPAQQDELRVLESFDLPGVLAEAQAEAGPQWSREEAARAEQGRSWSRFRKRVAERPAWVWAPALAAAAALLLLVWSPAQRAVGPTPLSPVQVAKEETPAAPSVQGDSGPPGIVVIPESKPDRPALTPVMEATRVARLEPSEERAAEPAPEATVLVESGWDPLEGSPPPPGHKAMAAGEGDALPPVRLAMVDPIYATPAGAVEFSLPELTLRSQSAASSARPILLAPGHLGRTASASPTLVYVIDGEVPAGARLSVLILAPEAVDPLLEQSVAWEDVGKTGRMRTELLELGVALEPSVPYTWMVVLAYDPDDPAREFIASGLIQHVRPSAEVERSLAEAEPGERPALWAAAGYWYDAAAELDALQRSHPDDPRVVRALDSLLQQGSEK